MGEPDAEIGVTVERPTEDQLGGGNGRLERDPDQILQVVRVHPIRAGDRALVRVEPDREVPPLEIRPHRLQ